MAVEVKDKVVTVESAKVIYDTLDASLSSHTGNTSNPHGVTKAQVGLGNVDNTSDANKPVSTAQKAAIDAVQTNLNNHKNAVNPHGITPAKIGAATSSEFTSLNDKVNDIRQVPSYSTSNNGQIMKVVDGVATWVDLEIEEGKFMKDETTLDSGSDLNVVVKSGVYRTQENHVNAAPGKKAYGQLLVLHGGGDTIAQLYFDYAGANVFLRQGTPEETGGGGEYSDWKRMWCEGNSITSAVWNDYAEYRESDTNEAGYVLAENGDDTLSQTKERLQHFAGIVSDTWGFSQGETEKAKTPIAVSGRVLAYPYRNRNEYKPGDCVCTAPGGTVDIMTREEVIKYPDRIVGTVSCVPAYKEWGGGTDRKPVEVNGRIWIKVR